MRSLRAAGHSPIKRGAFFQRPQCLPERGFYSLPLLDPEVLGGKRVAHPAAEAKKSILLNLPKHTTAIGTGERRRMTQAIFA
jgi:hypothetical protein